MTEECVEYLHDSRDHRVIRLLDEMPVVKRVWVYRPTTRRWLCLTLMMLLPIGLPVYLAALHAHRELLSDCRTIRRISMRIEDCL